MKTKRSCGFVLYVEGTEAIWVTDMPTKVGKAIRFLGGENQEVHLGVSDEEYSKKLIRQYQGIDFSASEIQKRSCRV